MQENSNYSHKNDFFFGHMSAKTFVNEQRLDIGAHMSMSDININVDTFL